MQDFFYEAHYTVKGRHSLRKGIMRAQSYTEAVERIYYYLKDYEESHQDLLDFSPLRFEISEIFISTSKF